MKIFTFTGDGPANQFEAGHQKGGNYFCWACSIVANRCDDTTYVYNLPYTSLQDRIEKVLTTPRSRIQSRNGVAKLYSNLKVDDIKKELEAREIKYL